MAPRAVNARKLLLDAFVGRRLVGSGGVGIPMIRGFSRAFRLAVIT